MAVGEAIAGTSVELDDNGKLRIGPILAEVMQAYRENAGTLLSLAAMIFLPLTLLTEIVSRDNITAGMIVSLAFSGSAAFLYGGMVAPLAMSPENEPPHDGSLGALWKGASPLFAQLLIAGIFYTVATTAGVMLLIVPGLLMITIWAATPAVIRFESGGTLASFTRSRDLVRGNGWAVFALMIAAVLIILALSVLIQALAIGIAGEETGAFIGSWLGVVIAAPILGLLPAVLYRRLATSPAEAPTPSTN